MIYLYSLLSIICFYIAIKINKRLNSKYLNTFVLTTLIIIICLLLAEVPYDDYMEGNQPINSLLGVSVVALALPLYQQLPQIRKYWKSILFIVSFASFFSMLTGAGFALWLGANPEIVATVISKSVTTPIAMAMSENLGGVSAVAAVGVALAGFQGAIFGYAILKKLGLKSSEGIGLAIGASSHAMGTVTIMEYDTKAGTYSSVALVLCGIVSSILAPWVFKLLYWVA